MTSSAPLDTEFAVDGLILRERTRWTRAWRGLGSFARHKPLGMFGILLILTWVIFAIGTLGSGGGWLGIGRYDSLTVFKEPSQEFANSKAALAFDGLPVDADAAQFLSRVPDPSFLGPLAKTVGVEDALYAYVVESIETGQYPNALMGRLNPVLKIDDGVYRSALGSFSTGLEAPLRTAKLQGPSSLHWLGTDRAGQDIYARIAEGARLSIMVGVFAAGIATGIGLIIGLMSGYLGGRFDLIIQRMIDAMQAFPPLVFLLLLAAVTRQSLLITILALGTLGIADNTRIVRGSVLATREAQYIEAARSLGAGGVRIATRHILPNIMAPVIIIFTISIGAFILAEATLSFLGLGPIKVSWGKMVTDGRQFILSGGAPWLSLWAGIAITTLVFGFNVAGDALRDTLDPRLRGGS